MAGSNESTTDERKPSEAAPAAPREPEAAIKVTDRRMFTPDGRLREEYSHLADAPPPEVAAPRAEAAPPQPAPPRPEPARPPAGAGPGGAGPGAPQAPPAGRPAPPGFDPEPSHPGAPGFFDLVAMIAESAAVYLGDARLPDGSSAEDLELARLHVDLLDVLRRKTAGNLTPQESAALDDVLYRLRVRYVQKRG